MSRLRWYKQVIITFSVRKLQSCESMAFTWAIAKDYNILFGVNVSISVLCLVAGCRNNFQLMYWHFSFMFTSDVTCSVFAIVFSRICYVSLLSYRNNIELTIRKRFWLCIVHVLSSLTSPIAIQPFIIDLILWHFYIHSSQVYVCVCDHFLVNKSLSMPIMLLWFLAFYISYPIRNTQQIG